MNRRDFLKAALGSAVACVARPFLPAEKPIPVRLNDAQKYYLSVDPAASAGDYFAYALHNAKKDELVWCRIGSS
jgi:hypothetical protein